MKTGRENKYSQIDQSRSKFCYTKRSMLHFSANDNFDICEDSFCIAAINFYLDLCFLALHIYTRTGKYKYQSVIWYVW